MSVGPLQVLVDRLRQAAPGGPSDGDLLERWARHRDEAAFELIVWRHGRLVLSVCRRVLRHAADVEDAFQATFLVLLRKARSIARGQALASWLHTVATRIALAARDRAARERHCDGVEALPAPPAPEPADDLRAVVDEEVGRLAEKYRIVFVLCCLEGKTDEAAARELGCPVGTVYSRLSRAREQLRQRLARRGIAPTAVLPVVLDVLPEATVHAAVALAAGGPATPAALALMEGAVHAMFVTKLKMAAAGVVVFAVLGIGTMAGHHGLSAQEGGVTGERPGKATRRVSPPPTSTTRAPTSLQAQLEQAKAQLALAQATVAKLQDAIKAQQDRDTGGEGRAKSDRATAALRAAEAELLAITRQLAVAQKRPGGQAKPEELDLLKAQVAKAKAEVELKQAELRLAALELARAAKATPPPTRSGGGARSAPSLEQRVKALEDQLAAMRKDLEKLTARRK